MRILIVSSSISSRFDDGTLVNDLVAEYVRDGHHVLVYAQDWSGAKKMPKRFTQDGVEFMWQAVAGHQFSIGKFGVPIKWALTSFLGRWNFSRDIDEFSPERIIVISTAIIHAGIILKISKIHVPKIIVQWDFFPFHHMQIGSMKKNLLTKFLARIEGKLINRFQKAAHMTTKNIDYFKKLYIDCKDVKSVLVPIWGPTVSKFEPNIANRKQTRIRYNLPHDKVICIFGGQLSKGRGIENILKLAEEAELNLKECYFVILGAGPLKQYIADKIASKDTSNIVLMDRLPRYEYQNFLKACDIGIVSTQGNVDVPTFPSKSIDYMRNKIPILASIEATTDFGDIILAANAGLFSVAGDHQTFFGNLKKLSESAENRRRMGDCGLNHFRSNHDVKIISQLLIQ